MEGKSTRAVHIAAAAVASLLLHAVLIGGAFLVPPRAGAPVGPRSAVPLRLVDAAPPTASGRDPHAVSQPTRTVVTTAGQAGRRVARGPRPAGPRRTAVGRRVSAAPGTQAVEPAGGTPVAGGEKPGASEAGGKAAPDRSDAADPVARETLEAGRSPEEDPLPAQRRAYALAVRRAIEAGRTYPVGARRRRAEGEVVIRVRIGASGLVDKVRVEESSGHPDLDRAALRFARSVARLPPPPGGPMWVRIPIEFTLR